MLRAGAAKLDVTPPLTIPYLGYVPRHAFFKGVHDPLYARAVVLERGDLRAAIISVDVIGLSKDVMGSGRNFISEVRSRIQQRADVPGAHVLLAATHAHSTPETANLERLLDTPEAAAWLETFADQLASVVYMARERLEEVVAKAGTSLLDGVGKNRRFRGGPVDPSLQAIAFERRDGSLHSLLMSYACHPVSVQVQPFVSADFPGVACRLVEETYPDSTCLFLQGASGDINPLRDTSGFRDVERYGRIVGGTAIALAAQLSAPEEQALGAPLHVASRVVRLPGRTLPDRDEALRELQNARRALDKAAGEDDRREAELKVRTASYVVRLLAIASDPVEAELMALRIGDAALTAIPGELFVELGLEIKKSSPAKHTLIATLANDAIGYLATDRAWQDGGYEVGLGPWCVVGEGGGSEVARQSLSLLEDLWT